MDSEKITSQIRLGLISHHPTKILDRIVVSSKEQQQAIAVDSESYRPNVMIMDRRLDSSHVQGRSSETHERSQRYAQRKAVIKELFEKQQQMRRDALSRSHEIYQHRLAIKENKFQDKMSSIERGSNPIEDIESYLHAKELADLRKQQLLYTAWNELVFNDIQEQINTVINDEGGRRRDRARYDLFDQYLKTAEGNRFLDIINPSEYNPFQWEQYERRYTTKHIEDPLKRDLKKFALESAMMSVAGSPYSGDGETKAPSCLEDSCKRLDVRQWAAGKIEATPYGYFTHRLDQLGTDTSRYRSRINDSSIVFDLPESSTNHGTIA